MRILGELGPTSLVLSKYFLNSSLVASTWFTSHIRKNLSVWLLYPVIISLYLEHILVSPLGWNDFLTLWFVSSQCLGSMLIGKTHSYRFPAQLTRILTEWNPLALG